MDQAPGLNNISHNAPQSPHLLIRGDACPMVHHGKCSLAGEPSPDSRMEARGSQTQGCIRLIHFHLVSFRFFDKKSKKSTEKSTLTPPSQVSCIKTRLDRNISASLMYSIPSPCTSKLSRGSRQRPNSLSFSLAAWGSKSIADCSRAAPD